MAVDRVERLLRTVTAALNDKNIDYAIVGGNAVAAWVTTVDEDAVRATKDVDVLVRRSDLADMTEALEPVDLVPVEVRGVYMFVDRENPNPKRGAHVVFAGELVMPHYAHPAPDPVESVETAEGYRLISLAKLVEMKLQAYRFIDRAHIQDLLAIGLIDAKLRAALPADLAERLNTIESESKQS